MKNAIAVLMPLLLSVSGADFNSTEVPLGARVTDRFNYGESDFTTNNYGIDDWGLVKCDDVSTCPGWPTNWEKINPFIPYNGTTNMCRDCSESKEGVCFKHKQSPILLSKKFATTSRQCNDRHRMRYWAGECRLSKMDFQILPHVLRAYQPKVCPGEYQPSIDFSRGFPEPWKLDFTDISVPAQHVIDGRSFAAEVVLSHTYSIDQGDRLIGNVSILLEKGTLHDKYDFLDLYIRKWQKVANKVARKCEFDVRNLEEEKESTLHNPRFRGDTSNPRHVKKPYYDREWHPYDWYVKANTEYYFRYEGSMPEPPCFEGVHWRVLKNPIKVAPSQLRALQNLISDRLNPDTCLKETAGVPRFTGARKVLVNRPIQTTTKKHKLVYCECIDWDSKSVADQAHCNLTMAERGVSDFVGFQPLSSVSDFPSESPSPNSNSTTDIPTL